MSGGLSIGYTEQLPGVNVCHCIKVSRAFPTLNVTSLNTSYRYRQTDRQTDRFSFRPDEDIYHLSRERSASIWTSVEHANTHTPHTHTHTHTHTAVVSINELTVWMEHQTVDEQERETERESICWWVISWLQLDNTILLHHTHTQLNDNNGPIFHAFFVNFWLLTIFYAIWKTSQQTFYSGGNFSRSLLFSLFMLDFKFNVQIQELSQSECLSHSKEEKLLISQNIKLFL